MVIVASQHLAKCAAAHRTGFVSSLQKHRQAARGRRHDAGARQGNPADDNFRKGEENGRRSNQSDERSR